MYCKGVLSGRLEGNIIGMIYITLFVSLVLHVYFCKCMLSFCRIARLPHAGGGTPMLSPHQETIIADMVHHNNAIKLHEIQQKVIEDHVNFQYFHFYIESVSTGFPGRTAIWIYFHGWSWVQSDRKERARMEHDWPTGHCCMVAVSVMCCCH